MAKKPNYGVRKFGVGAAFTGAAAEIGRRVGEHLGGQPFQVDGTKSVPDVYGGAAHTVPTWVDATQPMLHAAAQHGGKVGAVAGTLLGAGVAYHLLSNQFGKGK